MNAMSDKSGNGNWSAGLTGRPLARPLFELRAVARWGSRTLSGILRYDLSSSVRCQTEAGVGLAPVPASFSEAAA